MAHRRRKKKPVIYNFLLRLTLEEFEYLSLSAKAAIHNSMQRIIHEKLFGRLWKEETEVLRKQQNRLGHPPSDFWPLSYQEKMGVHGRTGRRPRVTFRSRVA